MTQAALILGLAIPVMGTVLGSACVFLVGDKMPARAQKAMLGFASGVMVAASVWSLLIPSLDMSEGSVVQATVGFLAGMAFLLLIDMLIPHVHAGEDKPEGVRAHLSRTTMLALAVTIHNLPEGMAVGVVLYGAMTSGMDIPVAAALAMSIGIAIQNIPEGAIVSMPMRAAGNSRKRFSPMRSWNSAQCPRSFIHSRSFIALSIASASSLYGLPTSPMISAMRAARRLPR